MTGDEVIANVFQLLRLKFLCFDVEIDAIRNVNQTNQRFLATAGWNEN